MSRTRPLSLLAAAFLALGAAAAALAQETPAGVAAGVNPAARGIPPVTPERTIFVGLQVLRNERILTEAVGQLQIIFLDKSTITIGPSSDMLIDEFVYQPATSTGRLAVTAGRGLFRFVGGAISKSEEVTINTPAAVIGIRGGIGIVEVIPAQPGQPGRTIATFLYGQYMRVTARNGTVRTIRRPGFSVTVVDGEDAGSPAKLPLDILTALIDRLEGRRPGVAFGQELDRTRVTLLGSAQDPSVFVTPGLFGAPRPVPGIGFLPDRAERELFDSEVQRQRGGERGFQPPAPPPPPTPPQPPIPPLPPSPPPPAPQ